MKIFKQAQRRLFLGVLICFLIPLLGTSQTKRLKAPKRDSKIISVDQFVDTAFNLYHKVFVYDSLTQVGVEIPSEVEDELVARAEKEIDSLYGVLPTVLDDLANGNANFIKKGKATLNLNKSKKALKYCLKMVKYYVVGREEDSKITTN